MRLRPVCVHCGIEMSCKKNSVCAKVGHNEVLSGDLYECQSCGVEIVTGWAQESFTVKPEFLNDPLVVVDLTG